MTPVAKTGLHCGIDPQTAGYIFERVTPVAKTGLHCGTVMRVVPLPLARV